MPQMPTPAEQRARFAELTAAAAAIRAKVDPLREHRDAVVNKAREDEQVLNDEIREAEAGLFEIEQERAMIVRALGGKTGEPAPEPEPAQEAE